MIRLIDATIESGQQVEGWMIETIAALRFEQRDGPMAGPLAQAEIRALVATDAFDAAIERLVDADTPLTERERRDLSDAAALGLTERADDAVSSISPLLMTNCPVGIGMECRGPQAHRAGLS